MRDFGVGLTEAEAESLFEYFDKDKSGSINYDEFIFSIRVRDEEDGACLGKHSLLKGLC